MKKLFFFFLFGFIFQYTLVLGQSFSNDDCLTCHNDPSLTKSVKEKAVSLYVHPDKFTRSAHGSFACIDCHKGIKEIPHNENLPKVECGSCHQTEKGDFAHSIHTKNKKEGIACQTCHTTHEVKEFSSQTLESRQSATQICAACHAQNGNGYFESDHGKSLMANNPAAPTCSDCHQAHLVKTISDSTSPLSRMNEATTCMKCHLDSETTRSRMGPSTGFIASYEKSVHGQAIHRGNLKAATCSDCHGGHQMKKATNPQSRVYKSNIAATCSKCHSTISDHYRASIHGLAVSRGNFDSPTCTNCHGEHKILSPQDPNSPVSSKNVSAQVCAPCHESVKMSEKYALASDRFKSFSDSYHGLASRAGSVEVANCASCHGIHDIKPSSDPTSSVNRNNLANTCGKCHPGSNVNFTKGAVHVISRRSESTAIYWISGFYIALIVSLIGGMSIHNLVDWYRRSKRKLMERRGLIARHHYGPKLYVRMTLFERIQHATLFISFFTLVITGFALKFPDAWWVASVRNLLGEWTFELRGILHRIAAVVMIATCVTHLYHVFFTSRGRKLIKDFLPVLQDVRDLVGMIRYNLGWSLGKPKFGRFSYIEKSEYWALVWGTIVMVTTGLILWFDNTFIGLLSKLGFDIARAIHYYEAWLAFLAILVWHFYFVIFNPDTYPMNLAWLKGTITEEEMAEEHPLELEEMKKHGVIKSLEEEPKTEV